jgi:RNA polymerase sigma-70 factor (ECF subfamily)
MRMSSNSTTGSRESAPPSDQTDFEGSLVDRLGRGDLAAFADVYDRHADDAYTLAYRICGDRLEAEQVTADALLAVWRGKTAGTSLRDALHESVCVHTAQPLQRRARAKSAGDRDERHPGRDGQGQRLARGDDLAAATRRMVGLAYFGQMSCSRLAELLQLSPQTVKAQLRVGLRALVESDRSLDEVG